VDTWCNYPILVPQQHSSHRFWRSSTVADLSQQNADEQSEAVLLKGVLGHEFDEDIDNGFRPAGLARLSHTTVDNVVYLQDHGGTFDSGSATHSLTLYRAASGALVFGAGTCQWSWGLDGHHDSPAGVPPHLGNPYVTRVGSDLAAPDRAVQQATVNLLADMGVQPASLSSSLHSVAPPPAWNGAPTSQVGSVRLDEGNVVVRGTAEAHEVVAGVEVSLDGERWHPAIHQADPDGRGESCGWECKVPWSGDAPLNKSSVVSRAVDDRGLLEGRDWTEQEAERAMWQAKGNIGC